MGFPSDCSGFDGDDFGMSEKKELLRRFCESLMTEMFISARVSVLRVDGDRSRRGK